LLYFLFEFFFW